MSKEAFETVVNDLVTAVDEAFKKPAPLPAFILLYSSIDILASLSRPVTQEDTSGSIFKSWVKKYVIGNSTFTWNEEDIWGARCGLLHTFTIQSRSSRAGVARELSYSGNQEYAKLARSDVD